MIAESTITVPELTGCLWLSEDSSLDRVKLSNLISQLTELLCKQYDAGTTWWLEHASIVLYRNNCSTKNLSINSCYVHVMCMIKSSPGSELSDSVTPWLSMMAVRMKRGERQMWVESHCCDCEWYGLTRSKTAYLYSLKQSDWKWRPCSRSYT